MLTYDVQGCTNAAVAGCAGVAGNNSYTYNANGERLTKTNSTGTTSYMWDALGNLLGVKLPNGTDITYL